MKDDKRELLLEYRLLKMMRVIARIRRTIEGWEYKGLLLGLLRMIRGNTRNIEKLLSMK